MNLLPRRDRRARERAGRACRPSRTGRASDEPATTVNVDAKKLDAAIARVDYAEELAPVKAAAIAKRGVAIDTDVYGERRVRALRYHRHFAAPIGGRHSMLGFLAVRGVPLGGLMLGRCGAPFSNEALSYVEALLPRLAIARASFRLPWRGAPLCKGRQSVFDFFRGERVLERAAELVVRDRKGYREMVAKDGAGELVWSRAALDEPSSAAAEA